MTPRAFAQILFRHRRKMLAVFLACLAAGGTYAVWRPVVWRAEAALLVEAGRPDGARTLAALLESRDLHRAVLEGMGARFLPAVPEAERAEAFAQALHIGIVDGAGLVRLSLDGPDGRLTAQVLAALLERLAEKNRTVFTSADPGGDLARQAAEAREKLAAFRRDLGLSGDVSRESLSRRRGELDAAIAAAETEANALSDRLAVVKARLEATPATIEISTESADSPVADNARAKLFELQTKEAELLGKYQDDSVFVRNLRAEKSKVESLLAQLAGAPRSRVTSGTNPVHQELETDSVRTEAALSSARARLKAAERQKADLDRRLAVLEQSAGLLARLEREAASADARLTARRGVSGAAIEGIGVVESATAAARPLGPAPREAMAMSAVAGLSLALLTAWLAQVSSSRLATPADVERRLGLPVLTSIPRES